MKKPKNYWTKERVFEESKNYQTRIDFKKGNNWVYSIARKNCWLDEMTWLEKKLEQYKAKIHSVYKYYFKENKAIYIGRTNDSKRREDEHRQKKDNLTKYANKNNLPIPPIEIIEDKLTLEESLIKEDFWKNYYKKKGYNILNIAKTGIGSGSIGRIGWGKWYRKSVFEEARKYQTRNEFKKGCKSAYYVAIRKGWLDEMDWFVNGRKPNEETRRKMSESHTNGKCSKPVLQIDRYTNEVIAEFPSAHQVTREKGYDFRHISDCCNGKGKTSYGFIWRYKESVA